MSDAKTLDEKARGWLETIPELFHKAHPVDCLRVGFKCGYNLRDQEAQQDEALQDEALLEQCEEMMRCAKAALTQNVVFPADIKLAKGVLDQAIALLQKRGRS